MLKFPHSWPNTVPVIERSWRMHYTREIAGEHEQKYLIAPSSWIITPFFSGPTFSPRQWWPSWTLRNEVVIKKLPIILNPHSELLQVLLVNSYRFCGSWPSNPPMFVGLNKPIHNLSQETFPYIWLRHPNIFIADTPIYDLRWSDLFSLILPHLSHYSPTFAHGSTPFLA